MRWLFWKEYRQNRVVVITLLVMLVAPHLFGLYGMWYDWHWMSAKGFRWQQIREDLLRTLASTSVFSLVISQLALALIGGNVIAGERADRSAEFQVYLPLTRKKILAAKLLLVLAIAVVVWTINPLILWSTFSSEIAGMPVRSDLPEFILLTAATGLVFFCVAWFFSSILRSATFSVGAGLVAPLVIWSLMMYGNYLVQGDHWKPGTELVLHTCYVCVSLAVALLSFGFGTWLYLRRVEP